MGSMVVGKDVAIETFSEALSKSPDFQLYQQCYGGWRERINIWIKNDGDRATVENFCVDLEKLQWPRLAGHLRKCFSCFENQPLVHCGSNSNMKYYKNLTLGEGSLNTVVYRGLLGDRPVAVKELIRQRLDQSRIFAELKYFIECDAHENVVRYFAHELVTTGIERMYIALELCDATLAEWVTGKYPAKIEKVNVLHQVTKGVCHLHNLRIIHRDIQPNNILLVTIGKDEVRVKISDFGISHKLPNDMTRVCTKGQDAGTDGWMAPEVLSHGAEACMSLESDIFALGCIFYYVLTNGLHPFGQQFHLRQANIIQNKVQLDLGKLSRLEIGFVSLVIMMTANNRKERPSANDILHHHIFWSKSKTLQFLIDVCNCLESVPSGSLLASCVKKLEECKLMSPYRITYDADRPINGWFQFLCPVLQKHVITRLKKRKLPYDHSQINNLLRFIRNIYNHYSSQPVDVKDALGTIPDGFLTYWTDRYPLLVDSLFIHFREAGSDRNILLHKFYTGCKNLKYDSFCFKELQKFAKTDALKLLLTPGLRSLPEQNLSKWKRKNENACNSLFM